MEIERVAEKHLIERKEDLREGREGAAGGREEESDRVIKICMWMP